MAAKLGHCQKTIVSWQEKRVSKREKSILRLQNLDEMGVFILLPPYDTQRATCHRYR